MNLLSAKGLAKATVAHTLLTLLVRRVGALDAPAAGVGVTRAIRTLGIVAYRPSALGRGVCCCRCGSEIGHGLVPSSQQVGFLGSDQNQRLLY